MKIKRNLMPKIWPIPRKGNKFVAVPSHSSNGLPLIIALRDILKLSKNRKESSRIIHDGNVKINGKIIRSMNFPLFILDILQIGNKNYEIIFKNNKLSFIESGAFKHKTGKVIGKKMLKNKKIQLNLLGGDNILSNEKIEVNDSVLLENSKIIKILKPKAGSQALILSGKHIGERGKIEEIKDKIALIKQKDKEIKVNLNQLIIVEND